MTLESLREKYGPSYLQCLEDLSSLAEEDIGNVEPEVEGLDTSSWRSMPCGCAKSTARTSEFGPRFGNSKN